MQDDFNDLIDPELLVQELESGLDQYEQDESFMALFGQRMSTPEMMALMSQPAQIEGKAPTPSPPQTPSRQPSPPQGSPLQKTTSSLRRSPSPPQVPSPPHSQTHSEPHSETFSEIIEWSRQYAEQQAASPMAPMVLMAPADLQPQDLYVDWMLPVSGEDDLFYPTPTTAHAPSQPYHLRFPFSSASEHVASFLQGTAPESPEASLSEAESSETEAARKANRKPRYKGKLSSPTPEARNQSGHDKDKPWVRTNATLGKTKRSARINLYKPEEVYEPLEEVPESWGPKDKYAYTRYGELTPGKMYKTESIDYYIRNHPLNAPVNGVQEEGLILWIQRNPADSARRYPDRNSNKCRFVGCPGNNCINQGHVRVTFDEQYWRKRNFDPMHNAGYVHLYCMERFLNFPDICYQFDVRVDNRRLPNESGERNRMALGSKKEMDIARRFIETCKTGHSVAGYPDRSIDEWDFEPSLIHKLTLAKIAASRHQNIKRVIAGKGGTIFEHEGELELETIGRTTTRKEVQRYGNARQAPESDDESQVAPRPRKRRRQSSEEEQEADASTIYSKRMKRAVEDQDQLYASKRNSKRKRRASEDDDDDDDVEYGSRRRRKR